MTPNDSSKKIDQLLQAWAKEHQPSPAHLENLIESVQQSLHNIEVRPLEEQASSRVRLPKWQHKGRYVSAWMAVAAVLLVGWLGWSTRMSWMGPMADPSQPEQVAETSGMKFDPTVQAGMMTLIQEARRAYDNRLVWLAETDDRVLVELSPEEVPRGAGWLSIDLRLELSATESVTGLPQTAWNVRLIVPSEQTVQIEGSESMPALTLWPYITEDGVVMIDTSIRDSSDSEGQATHSEIMPVGTATKGTARVGKYVVTHRVEYLEDASI